jgi:hypothetical protein
MLPVNGDLDFKNNAGILNLAPAIQNGQPIVYEQFNNAMSSKADLVNGTVPSSQLPSNIGGTVSFEHSINFPNSSIQDSTTQGTPTWAGTLTAIKATVSTISTAALTFKVFKNGVEIGTLKITAGDKIATATMSVAAAITDFFGASITASGGDATGVVFTFIFTKQ